MSANTLQKFTRLLILAEAARAVSQFEAYEMFKEQAKKLRLTNKSL